TPYDERTTLRRLEVGDWSAKQLMQRVSAAVARTSASMAARQDALQQQVDTGGVLPSGIVARGGATPTRHGARPAAPTQALSSAPSAAAATPPTPAAAAPA